MTNRHVRHYVVESRSKHKKYCKEKELDAAKEVE